MNNKTELTFLHSGHGDDLSAGESQSIEWYAEGESRAVEIDGLRITVRLVGRKGRRARIAVTAPPGVVFRSLISEKPDRVAQLEARNQQIMDRIDSPDQRNAVNIGSASISLPGLSDIS